MRDTYLYPSAKVLFRCTVHYSTVKERASTKEFKEDAGVGNCNVNSLKNKANVMFDYLIAITEENSALGTH